MATNVRYLQRQGVDTPVAVAGIGVSSVGTFMVHMTLLVMSVVFLGRNAGDFVHLPSAHTVMLAFVVIFGLLTLAWLLPIGRKVLKKSVWPIIKQSGSGIAQVATSPKNALMLFGGAFAMIMGYITALWFSLEAFGGGLTFVGIALVFLAGQALGQAAPTPGGIGATEAAMIAAMTALGLDAAVAVPTVFLYRIATFWLPILPGFYALRKLEADDAL
jgi:undecaprenyl-diphosphatase